jgi:lipoprotein-anchoring transpeptidase ErfK/SrfK
VDTERWVGIDLYEQVLTVYEGQLPIFTTLVSTGLPRWPTYEGTFNIYFRRTRADMSWGTPGDDFYYLQEVPWTMYFDQGRALHGAYWHDGLGYRRSHGCVNMSITDAHWLYRWVAEEFEYLNSPDREVGPAVHVYSSGEYVS